MAIDALKKLRDVTGAGVMDCKAALKEAEGNFDRAIEIIRHKGLAIAKKKESRVAKEGIIGSYIHMQGEIGVLIEVNCETDFVAKNEDFKNFVKDIAMQIAATNPTYLKKEDVPQEVLNKEKDFIKSSVKDKPQGAIEKIVEGKLQKFYSETCLLEQPFIKDENVIIKDYLAQLIAKTGENLIIRRFTRYKLGE